MHRLRESGQNKILQLNCVVREGIHEVEMEVAEELRVVLENDQDNVHRGGVETPHGRSGLLTSDEVTLDEGEAAHEQVLHLV